MRLRLPMPDDKCDVPRKGNVDRNEIANDMSAVLKATFPARGTWIEMQR